MMRSVLLAGNMAEEKAKVAGCKERQNPPFMFGFEEAKEEAPFGFSNLRHPFGEKHNPSAPVLGMKASPLVVAIKEAFDDALVVADSSQAGRNDEADGEMIAKEVFTFGAGGKTQSLIDLGGGVKT